MYVWPYSTVLSIFLLLKFSYVQICGISNVNRRFSHSQNCRVSAGYCALIIYISLFCMYYASSVFGNHHFIYSSLCTERSPSVKVSVFFSLCKKFTYFTISPIFKNENSIDIVSTVVCGYHFYIFHRLRAGLSVTEYNSWNSNR